MNPKFNAPRAFTLVEVLVSLVIVTIIGAVSWTAVNVLSPTSQATQNRIKAEHLITLSEEELHQYGQNQNNFDGTSGSVPINNCNFLQPNNCGFAGVSGQFPGYTRTLTYIQDADDSTLAIKKFDIQVTWQESGQPKVLDSVILLARPSDPLPGNIYGYVTDTNGPLTAASGLSIVATIIGNTNGGSTANFQANPVPPCPMSPCNYTFAQPGTGFYVLPAGTYQLQATANGYFSYTYPNNIVINNNAFNATFQMKLKPLPATITATLVDGSGPLSFPANTPVPVIGLDQNGGTPSNVSLLSSTGGSSTFQVTFNDTNPQCFTLFTSNAYKSNLAGQFNWNGFTYQADGWSSAAVQNSPIWVGGQGFDNVCVTPTQNITPNIPLVQVPTATVTVLVQYQNGPVSASPADPIYFTVDWHDGTNYSTPIITTSSNPTTESPGYYQIMVPAEQELFPNDPSHDVAIYARWGIPTVTCCNQTGLQFEVSNQKVGPLYSGNDLPTTISFNPVGTSQSCGDVNGQVLDDSTISKGPVSASVLLNSAGFQTTIGGYYSYQCPTTTPPYFVPAGLSGISVSAQGYYPYNTAGFDYYNAQGTTVNVIANQLNPLAAIYLWPMGYGTITGTVTDLNTGQAIGSVPVNLTLGTGSCPANTSGTGDTIPCMATTANNGTFEFDNVPETWPPPAVVGNPHYNQQAQNDSLSIADSNLYYGYSSLTNQPKGFTVTASPAPAAVQNIQLQHKTEL